MHSPRMVLVDRDLRVRGTYDTLESDALERVERDLRVLIDRGGS